VELPKHKLIEMTESTYAVLLEDNKVELCQEQWKKEVKVYLNKDEIIKLADELKKTTL